MPSSPPRVYWDACVLLAYVNGEPDRTPHINAFLTDAEKKAVEILTSMLSVVEVAFVAEEKANGKLDPALKQRIDELWAPTSPVRRVEFHFGIADDSRDLIRRAMVDGWRLQPADAIHLATALRMDAEKVHTYEKESRRIRWSNLIGIPVEEPAHPSPPFL